MGKNGLNATLSLFFLGLGWPWVGEFVGFIIIHIAMFFPSLKFDTTEYIANSYYWPPGILSEYIYCDREYKTQTKRNEVVDNAHLKVFSGRRWIIRESELVSWSFQYNTLQSKEKYTEYMFRAKRVSN